MRIKSGGIMPVNLLRIEEAAEIMGLSRSYVYRLVKCGGLPAARFGSAVRIRSSDLDRYIESKVHVARVEQEERGYRHNLRR
jgi:excisionase family DNA binding protein